jgi:hypothetical protein
MIVKEVAAGVIGFVAGLLLGAALTGVAQGGTMPDTTMGGGEWQYAFDGYERGLPRFSCVYCGEGGDYTLSAIPSIVEMAEEDAAPMFYLDVPIVPVVPPWIPPPPPPPNQPTPNVVIPTPLEPEPAPTPEGSPIAMMILGLGYFGIRRIWPL